MGIKIINEKENPLFSRKEIQVEIASKSVPSHIEVKSLVAKKFSVNENVIRIKEIKGKFGVSVFTVNVNIYSSLEEFNRIVKKTKQEIDAEKKAIEEIKAAKEEKLKAAIEAKAAADAPKEEEKSVEENKDKIAEESVSSISEGGDK